MKKYGYLRENHTQSIKKGKLLMLEEGIEEGNIYIDKKDRKEEFIKVKAILQKGDCLYVDSMRSIGESYMQENWQAMHHKGIALVVFDFPGLHSQMTYAQQKEIMHLGLEFYKYFKQIEIEERKEKQAIGIKKAREKGIQFGRRELQIPQEFKEVNQRWKKGEISGRRASIILNVDYKTFKKWVMLEDHKIQEVM